jgi:phosphoglycerol geranylgeranyltransferase
MHPWAEWNHVVKLDPDKTLVDGESFEAVAASGTDAIAIGGTTGMTEEKMGRVVEACGRYDVPVFIEPSHLGAVYHSKAHDGYLVPVVFNAGDPTWITGAHKEWIRLDKEIDWSRTYPEAYVVLNEESAVAEYTGAHCGLTPDEVAAYATVAERLFAQPIIYIEYSGTLGDSDAVAAAKSATESASVFYGGGIHDYDSAHEMATHADVVVVGDLVHDQGVNALQQTVHGAADAN